MDISRKKKYCADLKNVRQWLRSTKTRCDSLKSHMEYMKMVCYDIPKVPNTDKTMDDLKHHSRTEFAKNDLLTTSTQANCSNNSEECPDIPYTSVIDDDNDQKQEFCLSPNLENIISKINILCNEDEETKCTNERKQSQIELFTDSPKTYSIPQSTRIQSRPLSPIHKENMYREQNHNLQYPYQKDLEQYSAELVQNVNSPKKLFGQLVFDEQNDYLVHELSPTRNNIKLNISEGLKNGSISKNKMSAKHEKNNKSNKTVSSGLSSKKGSTFKLDNIVSLKLKKRRRKLHSSNSKSTVTTKDINVLPKKDTKKRKQKYSGSIIHSGRPQHTSNEVVEIYHNTAATSGSTCGISNKHSKLDRHMNYINILSSVRNKPKAVNAKPKCQGDYQHNPNTDENSQHDNYQKQYVSKNETHGRINISNRNCDLEDPTIPEYTMTKCNSHQCNQSILQTSYCDPLITHNYEMPTMASKLKRANRSYFSRFNFRNIPFVVGTSVTPSHNLGLNIQQVLSIMKTKQPRISGITPILIRKVSRGIKPISLLMEQINDQYSKLSCLNAHVDDIQMKNENSFMNQTDNLLENESVSLKCDRSRLNNLNVNLKSTIRRYQNVQEMVKGDANVYESHLKKKDIKSENQLNTVSSTHVLQSTDNAKLLKLFASQQNVKLKDNDKHIFNVSSLDDSKSSKGIREVLVHLHDQFEEMNMKYEKLQEKAKKCNNKSLEEEILNLEKELNAKEDEINAVISLYKEVMVLKRQMRSLQEKNSYVCISSEIPLQSNKTHSVVPFSTTKSFGTNDQQKLYHRHGTSVVSTREPTSIRLTGLLRQIQTFQRQLKLSS